MTDAQFAVRRARPSDSALLMLLEEVARAANEADSVEEAGRLALHAVCRSPAGRPGTCACPTPDDPGGARLQRDLGAPATTRRLRRAAPGHRGDPVPARGRAGGHGRGEPRAGVDRRRAGRSQLHPGPARRGPRVASAMGCRCRAGAAGSWPSGVLQPRHMPPDEELLRVMGTIGDQLGRVADRVQARREVEASARRRLEQIIETSAEAFVEIDAGGRSRVERRRRADVRAAPGPGARPAAGGDDRPAVAARRAPAGLARFLATGEKRVIGKRIEIVAWRPDIGEFPVELAIWALREGDTWSFNAFLHDIRDRRRGEEALREAYEQERANAARLGALDQAKDDFVATVSHELRTPLTSSAATSSCCWRATSGRCPSSSGGCSRRWPRAPGGCGR